MSAIAIIPARGGSKGIPRKNVLMLAGKPLLAWMIEAARSAETIDQVIVSTDSSEIAAVAQQFGAEVVWRPAELSGDTAASEGALLHTLTSIAERGSADFDLTVFLQCTSPLTLPEDIDGTVRAVIQEDADTGVAVTDFHYFLWTRGPDGYLVGINHDKKTRLLRQQRHDHFLEAGSVYVMNTTGFLEHRHRFFGRTACHVVPNERVLEIDEPADLRVAEVLLQDRLGQGVKT